MYNSLKILLPAVCVANLVSAQLLVDYQFDDDNGTAVQNGAANNGTSAASWNFGVGTVQAGNLNYGYTANYKFTQVDAGADTTAQRKLTFANDLTTSDMTQYSFTVDFSKWDLRQAWDTTTNSASAPNKGIQIILDSTSGGSDNQAIVGFKTTGTNGFHAYSQGEGSSYTQAYGSEFDTDGAGTAVSTLSRYEAAGGLMQINGDLSLGTWSAQAKTGEDGADWVALGNGTGLTTIDSIIFAAKTPAIGSWGGGDTGTIYSGDATTAGTTGDYMSIDSITLSNTISISDGGLEQNMLAVLEPGKSYHISAWARSSSSGTVQLDMRETNGSGQATDVAIGSLAANNTEFLLIEGDYTVPDNLTGLSLVAQGASFSLDHVQVYEYQTPNIVASVVMDDGEGPISLGWNAELGVSYRLEQSLDLANGWTVLESNLTADKSNMIWDLTPDPAVSRAFWRVIKNP